MGIEPTLAAWEAAVLPLNYTRVTDILPASSRSYEMKRVDITLNGERRELPAGTTLAGLIERLGLGGRLAVERNGEIVPRSAYATTALASGDHIEIVRAIGGG